MITLQIAADPKCHYCYGSGYVTDWVPMPFGSGNTAMESICDCVLEQLTEEQAGDDNLEIEPVAYDDVFPERMPI